MVGKWCRGIVAPIDSRSLNWLEDVAPDDVLHLAMGSETWAAQLADYAKQHDVPMVFTSTAMVFDHSPNGPHQINHLRTAKDDYGSYKIRCEDAVLAANPNACVARIGYQMDLDMLGNNMLAHLEQQAKNGGIEASRTWIPACSFMSDTALALCDLLEQRQLGVFHLDSNQQTAYGYDKIVVALKTHLNRDWAVRVTETYSHDQRLVGSNLLPKLHHMLPELLQMP